MRVSRIEIFGFKSFMERLVLPLEGGVTGVVGPNGCGKSNIVDAVRWVLGETRASQLRGSLLEDVIFNGTDTLRPLGLAEVTITVRANDDSTDLLEELIALNPETTLNNETLNSEANESEGEAQENSEEDEKSEPEEGLRIVKSKEEDFEEQPAKLTPKDEKASIQASSSQTRARYGWLKGSTEFQATRRLYRSGESEYFINRVPCRLKDLRDLFRACGLGPRAYTLVAQGEVAKIITAKPEERRLILEDAAGILGFREKIAEANRRLSDTTNDLLRLADREAEISRSVASLRRQANRALARKELKETLLDHDRKIYLHNSLVVSEQRTAFEGKLSENKERETTLEKELVDARHVESQRRGELLEIDIKAEEHRAKSDTLQKELSRRDRQRVEYRGKLKEVQAFISARETEKARLEERKTTLFQRQEVADKEVQTLQEEEKRIAEEISQFDSSCEEELREISTKLTSLRGDLRTKDHEIRDVRDKISSSQGRLSAIQEQVVAASPLTQLSKALGSDVVSSFRSEVSILVDEIKVPEAYTKATQAVLAERSAFLLSSEPHQLGRKFLGVADGRSKDDKRRPAMGVFREGQPNEEQVRMNVDGIPFPSLLSLISVSERAGFAAQTVFLNVFVAPNTEEALAFFERSDVNKLPQTFLIVTGEGDIVGPHSFFSLRHEGGVLQLKLNQERLSVTIEELTSQFAVLNTQKEQLQQEIAKAETRHAELLQELQSKQTALRALGNQQGSVRGRLGSEKRVLEQIKADMSRLEQQMVESASRMDQWKEQAQTLEKELADLPVEADQPLKDELSEVSAELKRIDDSRREGYAQLERLASEARKLQDSLDSIRREASSTELDLKKLDLDYNALSTRVINEYGDEIIEGWKGNSSDEDVRLSEEVLKTAETEAHAIRTRIAREGEVDPSSIDQYEEEKARLEPLQNQKRDLEEAAQALKNSIEHLRLTSQERFAATFEAVRNNFVQLVPRLFGGGKAELELSDAENPLDSGVQILVRPPGKKPKSIELLSGGEKALVATALIISMFLERPSPLCILDEVDAPLDDANLGRFLEVIQEMTSKTQFLMITHNKQSMAAAKSLVGVTMPTPGATKVISVSLQEALKQAA